MSISTNQPRLAEQTLLCVIAFLIPLIGGLVGVYLLVQEDSAKRNTGKAALGWAICGFILGVVLWGIIVGITATVNY